MTPSPLAALREAAPGSPTLRQLAKKIGLSYETVRQFEAGVLALKAENVVGYAKGIAQAPDVVQRMFIVTALRYHRRRVMELLGEMKAPRGKGLRGHAVAGT